MEEFKNMSQLFFPSDPRTHTYLVHDWIFYYQVYFDREMARVC